MRGSTVPEATDNDDFNVQLETALKQPSDEAARSMLARGRAVTYCERDTPSGYVIREHPDGTTETVRIDLAAEARAA